eukprot:CAMPEP_0201164810 /NCGR_PEP_ID=MMETSP0851-20130426/61473_1 /ASSEMBLY_ACC=CAM_ASM_000631 /TAXON_ID=183588 /ORGANISM="Pseudo-nitzschia fraudulenta, Strain WWA7" /LENGTH=202 /DNA_ID=CAMNT_0047445315 /DNA_START=23 /DNA_END=631 /DNA_ORIENTATION=-
MTRNRKGTKTAPKRKNRRSKAAAAAAIAEVAAAAKAKRAATKQAAKAAKAAITQQKNQWRKKIHFLLEDMEPHQLKIVFFAVASTAAIGNSSDFKASFTSKALDGDGEVERCFSVAEEGGKKSTKRATIRNASPPALDAPPRGHLLTGRAMEQEDVEAAEQVAATEFGEAAGTDERADIDAAERVEADIFRSPPGKYYPRIS